jgi:hypothetical protein
MRLCAFYMKCLQINSFLQSPGEVPVMKRIVSLLGASLLVITLLTSYSKATQIIYQSPKKMGEESSLVVLARVSSVRSYWNETGTKIFTETVVDIDETYKGQAVPYARIVQLGGVVGNVRMTVHGALHWRPGEEVLLFLEPYMAGTYQVSGFSQGRFEIERDPLTGKAYVKGAPMEGAEALRAPAGEEAPLEQKETRIPLRRFVSEALGGL